MKKETVVCDACERHVEDGEYLSLEKLDLCDDCQRIVSDVFRSETDVLYENLLYAARGVVRLSDAVVSDQTTEISGGLASELLRLKVKVEVIDERQKKPREITKQVVDAIEDETSQFEDGDQIMLEEQEEAKQKPAAQGKIAGKTPDNEIECPVCNGSGLGQDTGETNHCLVTNLTELKLADALKATGVHSRDGYMVEMKMSDYVGLMALAHRDVQCAALANDAKDDKSEPLFLARMNVEVIGREDIGRATYRVKVPTIDGNSVVLIVYGENLTKMSHDWITRYPPCVMKSAPIEKKETKFEEKD